MSEPSADRPDHEPDAHEPQHHEPQHHEPEHRDRAGHGRHRSAPEPHRLPGDPIVFRGVVPARFGGQTPHAGFTYPAVVLEDTGDTVATYQEVGTSVMSRTGRRGPDGRNMLPGGWDGGYLERRWVGSPVVRVHRVGDPWSVWRWLEPDGQWSRQFYVNLEDPWRRSALGWDSHDWVLDLIVWRDPPQFQYKDEDELAWCESVGVISAETAAQIRAAGEQALRTAEEDQWPFSADWDRWRPDPAWPVPALPDGWQKLD